MTEAPRSTDEAMASRLSRFADCWIDLQCACGQSTQYPVKLLIRRRGDLVLGHAISRMRCKQCGSRPSEAHLQQTIHRDYPPGTGPGIFEPPGWAIRLDTGQS